VVLHGFVEDFAQSGSIFSLCLPNLKLRPCAGGAHGPAFYHHKSFIGYWNCAFVPKVSRPVAANSIRAHWTAHPALDARS
jgi:hypothetical protein